MSYLGHEFSASGMLSSQKKIEAIVNWPVPTNITQHCQFLGLAIAIYSTLQIFQHLLMH